MAMVMVMRKPSIDIYIYSVYIYIVSKYLDIYTLFACVWLKPYVNHGTYGY